jgi:nitronate monooxygenase
MATAGLPQVRAGKHVEAPIVTMGDDLIGVARFLPPGASGYSAADVIAAIAPAAS